MKKRLVSWIISLLHHFLVRTFCKTGMAPIDYKAWITISDWPNRKPLLFFPTEQRCEEYCRNSFDCVVFLSDGRWMTGEGFVKMREIAASTLLGETK